MDRSKDEWSELFYVNQEHQWCLNWQDISNYLYRNFRLIAFGSTLYLHTGIIFEEWKPELFRKWLDEKILMTHKVDYSIKKANEVYNRICDRVQEEHLDSEEYIAFQNGVYCWKSNTFLTPNQFNLADLTLINQLNVSYDPQSGVKEFLRMLHIMFNDEEKEQKILRFMAYTLTSLPNNLRYHQLIWGKGNNGKSQLVEHWGQLLGNTCSFIPFNVLLNDPHACVGLRNKHLNICSEIGGAVMSLAAVERCKGILTDMILPGRDLYESQRNATHKNHCKHWVTSNELPYSEFLATAKAFFDRWELIECTYEWDDKDWLDYMDENGSTKTTFDQIFTREGPGIVAFVLSFLPEIGQLRTNWIESRENWQIAGNSVVAFIHNPGITDDRDTEKRVLFNQYKKWCEENDKGILSYQTFCGVLKRRGYQERAQLRLFELDGDSKKETIYIFEGICYDKKKEDDIRNDKWLIKHKQDHN